MLCWNQSFGEFSMQTHKSDGREGTTYRALRKHFNIHSFTLVTNFWCLKLFITWLPTADGGFCLLFECHMYMKYSILCKW